MKKLVVYTPDDYDRNNVLKVPGLLVLTMVYLLKHPLLMLLPYVPRMGDVGYLGNLVDQTHFHWSLLLVSCLPAVLVLYGMIRRIPKGGPRPRWCWRHGRNLLRFALLGEMIVLAGLAAMGIQEINESLLVIFYIDIMMLIYVWRSQRVYDVFLEFPKPEEKKPLKNQPAADDSAKGA